MNIYINGQAYSLDHETKVTINSALNIFFTEPQQTTYAVALNGDFISKNDYDTTDLKSGDCVDVLLPIQGG